MRASHVEQISNLWGSMPQSAATAKETRGNAILNLMIIFTWKIDSKLKLEASGGGSMQQPGLCHSGIKLAWTWTGARSQNTKVFCSTPLQCSPPRLFAFNLLKIKILLPPLCELLLGKRCQISSLVLKRVVKHFVKYFYLLWERWECRSLFLKVS